MDDAEGLGHDALVPVRWTTGGTAWLFEQFLVSYMHHFMTIFSIRIWLCIIVCLIRMIDYRVFAVFLSSPV